MTLDEEWDLYLLVDEILYFLSICELFKDIVSVSTWNRTTMTNLTD